MVCNANKPLYHNVVKSSYLSLVISLALSLPWLSQLWNFSTGNYGIRRGGVNNCLHLLRSVLIEESYAKQWCLFLKRRHLTINGLCSRHTLSEDDTTKEN